MMPPKGACLSVAKALSQASRRLSALADAAGIHVLENRQRRGVAGKFGDQGRGGGEVQNVVIGKFLAVELLEIFVEIGHTARRAGADFRHNASDCAERRRR